MDNATFKEGRQKLQSLIDFIILNTEEGSFEHEQKVNRNINEIERLFWECL